MNIPPEILELADTITIGDLLSSPLSVDATIRALGAIRTSMAFKAAATRSPDEADMENAINRVRSSLPRETVRLAYINGEAEYEERVRRGLVRNPHTAIKFTAA